MQRQLEQQELLNKTQVQLKQQVSNASQMQQVSNATRVTQVQLKQQVSNATANNKSYNKTVTVATTSATTTATATTRIPRCLRCVRRATRVTFCIQIEHAREGQQHSSRRLREKPSTKLAKDETFFATGGRRMRSSAFVCEGCNATGL